MSERDDPRVRAIVDEIVDHILDPLSAGYSLDALLLGVLRSRPYCRQGKHVQRHVHVHGARYPDLTAFEHHAGRALGGTP